MLRFPTNNRTLLLPLNVKGHRFTIRISKTGSVVTASCDVPTPYGPVVVSSSCDERLVRHVLEALHGNLFVQRLRSVVIGDDGNEDEVAGIFEDIGEFFSKTIPKEAKKLTRTKVFRDVAKGIGEVTNHPAWNAAMVAVNVIPGYGQAISAAMGGMKMASAGLGLLAQAKGGDPKARQKIAQLDQQAAAGDPNAQKAMATLKGLNQLKAKQPTGGQQAAQAAQAGLGMAGQLAGKLGGDTQAGKAVQGAANLGAGIAGAFKQGANAGETASNILGGLGQFASAFMGEDDEIEPPPVVGGFPSYVGEVEYQRMVRQIASEPSVLDMQAGDDGVFTVAGAPTKPFKVTRRVKYGLPAPRLKFGKLVRTRPRV